MVAVSPQRKDLIDTAGTGGDGTGSFNISTAAALVASAAGAGVAKHGNRAVSSASGSADVLEALGFDLNLEPFRIAESIDRYGFGFLFAPIHHPAMRHAVPVRKELATKTVFNILGPLTNPARAQAQIVGVYAPDLAATMAQVMVLLGTKRALVIHGADGMDELSPSGVNLVYEVTDGEVEETTLDPQDLGVERCNLSQLRGGTPTENATTTRMLLQGRPGPLRDAVLLNAAAALRVAGIADGYQEGLTLAQRGRRFGGCRRPPRGIGDVFARADGRRGVRSLRVGLRGPGLRAIAEVKRRSPSAGVLRGDADAGVLAASFEPRGSRGDLHPR